MRRSRVEGPNQLRRKLRRMDPAITGELRGVLLQAMSKIGATEVALMPVDTGAMRDAVEFQISADGLSGIVGPAAKAAEIVRRRTGSEFGRTVKSGKSRGQKIKLRKVNKVRLMQFYKAYWLNFGTKGSDRKNIPAQPALRFVERAYQIHKAQIASAAKLAINSVLRRVASG